MNKTVVIYKSKYGAVEKYAQWISESLSCDIFELGKFRINHLEQYDTIIFGSAVYAGRINGVSFIKKNFDRIKDKKVVLFYLGMSDPAVDDSIWEIVPSNLNTEMRSCIETVYLRGEMDYKKLRIIHKIMISMMKSMISKKEVKTEADKVFLKNAEEPVSYIEKSNIKEVLKFVI